MAQCVRRGLVEGCPWTLSILAFCLVVSGCTSVDTILLTSDTFAPKGSGDEVAVLEEPPARLHQDIAELRIGSSWIGFGHMQRKILNQAATLGADAVVFAKPKTVTLHEAGYQPRYGPWGYHSPYYGTPWGYGGYGGSFGSWSPWGGGYSSGMVMTYDETTRMLMGTAIRYTEAAGGSSHQQSEEPSSQRDHAARQEPVEQTAQ